MQKGSEKFDIVIVGAGVIGSVLALLASKLGYQVAVIDAVQETYPATNPERVIALSQGSAQLLQTWGVWPEMIQAGAGWIKDIYVAEPGCSARVDMSCDEISAEALGYVMEIRHILMPLHETIARDVRMICPAQVLALQQQAAGNTLIQIQTSNGLENIETQLLVGADGTNSEIRRLAKISTLGWDHNRTGIVASIQSALGHGNVAYECFRQEGPLALLPLADGRFSLVWSVAPRHGVALMNMEDAAFLQALEDEMGGEVLARVGALQHTSPRAAFPLELRVAKTFAQAGLLLVGNAAHTIHPIAGQGMNLGLRDVAILLEVLRANWAKSELSSPFLAQAYAERRRADMVAVALFTESTLHAFASPLLPTRWLRGVGLSLTQSVPALKQILLQQASGLGQQQRMKI